MTPCERLGAIAQILEGVPFEDAIGTLVEALVFFIVEEADDPVDALELTNTLITAEALKLRRQPGDLH
jgi:hypothetical protein